MSPRIPYFILSRSSSRGRTGRARAEEEGSQGERRGRGERARRQLGCCTQGGGGVEPDRDASERVVRLAQRRDEPGGRQEQAQTQRGREGWNQEQEGDPREVQVTGEDTEPRAAEVGERRPGRQGPDQDRKLQIERGPREGSQLAQEAGPRVDARQEGGSTGEGGEPESRPHETGG